MISDRFSIIKDIPLKILWTNVSLTILGLIILNSISKHHQGSFLDTPFGKQIIILIPAFIIMIMVLLIPRYSIHKYSYPLYLLGIAIVIIPYFGPPRAGTYRWLDIGLPFAIQTSEFAKIFTTLALARYLSDHTLKMKKFTSVIFPFLLVIVPSIIVMNQTDLGTSLVMLSPIIPMLYWSGSRPFYLFLMIAPALSIITAFHTMSFTIWAIILGITIVMARSTLRTTVFLFFSNLFLGLLAPFFWDGLNAYQQNRILTFFNPEKDPLGIAYQLIQSKTAIGSGGMFGKGWGSGTQTHLKFLPVQESDFILSVIGEEMGFVTIATLLIIMGYLITKILGFAFSSKDRFSSLALVGIATIFLAHVFVNTAMTVGLIPVKGLPFPFISAGGSFLISSYMMIGLVLKLSINYTD